MLYDFSVFEAKNIYDGIASVFGATLCMYMQHHQIALRHHALDHARAIGKFLR